MYTLNLPQYEYNVKKADGKVWIFDVIRKKYIVLTPEEWVRQHFLHYLMHHLGYPKSLIRVEGGLSYNQLKKRSDIVVFDRAGQPWMVIECKSPEIKITSESLHQVSVYNASLKARYVTVTNGLNHYCAQIDWAESKTMLLDALPAYSG